MDKTKIDWCDSTWNPVTGCLHGCEYCYARQIAERFGGGCHVAPHYHDVEDPVENVGVIYEYSSKTNHVLDRPYFDAKLQRTAPYPFYFDPTFHRYKLDEYVNKKGRNIFVCSMADLFGKWVPDDWKIEILEACRKAPQHNYLFLTKDPIGYSIWNTEKNPHFTDDGVFSQNMWLGVTYTGKERLGHYQDWEIGHSMSVWTNFWYLWRMSENILPTKAHKFLSIEPLLCDIREVEDEREGGKLLEHFLLPRGNKSFFEWIIVGTETGRRKNKITPKREWIEKLLDLCRRADIPVFMKTSLTDIWGEPLIQEFPKELRRKG